MKSTVTGNVTGNIVEFPVIQTSAPVLPHGAESWFEYWKQLRLDFENTQSHFFFFVFQWLNHLDSRSRSRSSVGWGDNQCCHKDFANG